MIYEVLEKYGESVTYSLLYKDLYPQDAKNLESVLQGLDAGSISREQAVAVNKVVTLNEFSGCFF